MKISALHYLVTSPAQAETACQSGIDWIQLRLKNYSYESWKAIALETKSICRQYGATLIINDNVELAAEIEADGVHLGKTDMPVSEARQRLGSGFIIGGTANTTDDVRIRYEAGADYIGLGPYRFTHTKENLSPILGLEGFQRIREQTPGIPIIGIGGITLEDVVPILETGLDGFAVSSAITHAPDPVQACQHFLNELNHVRLTHRR